MSSVIIAMDISQAESFGVSMGQIVAVAAGTLQTVVRMDVTVPGTEPNTGAITIAHGARNATMYHV